MAAVSSARAVLRRGLVTMPASALQIKPFKLKSLTGYINGKWAPAASGKTLDVINPATGDAVAAVSDQGRAETLAAVEAAAAAFPAWSAKPAGERATLLRKLFDAMQANSEGLAALLTLECGKPLEEAKGEIAYASSFFDWYAGEAPRMYGDIIPPPRADRRMLALRQPVGVAALLAPWNFSSAMVTRKLAPALAAGCTVVIRPSANTPLSAIAVAQLAEEVGIPAGVVNLVVGHDHDGIAGTLCRHPTVKKVSFTGSTRVGRLLMSQSADSLKKLSLELGGNAAFIVFDDADIDAAVEGAMLSKFRNAGQTCVCANRILVQRKAYPAFVAKLKEKVATLKVGDGFDPATKVGPLITKDAMLKTQAFVKDAVAKGAKVLAGGNRASHVNGGKGWFFEATLLENVTKEMNVMADEIFGPVAPVAAFDTEAEAVALANSVDVGLAGYFFTRDVSRAWRVAEALQVGMVGVNTGIISTAAAPFGGVKQSGFGREGSKYGLDEYTFIKYVMMGI